MGEAELPDIAAYLELHIEQGPRLEEIGKPAAAVIGCFGVERHAITFTGKASHAGSHADEPAPRRLPRRRPLRPGRARVARSTAAAWRRSAPSPPSPASRRSSTSAARSRSTSARSSPSSCATCSPTSRPRPTGSPTRTASTVEWKRIWQIDPIPFDERLVDLAAQAIGEITGDEDPPRLPSGALHDAAEVARHAPTVMVFSSSHRRRQPLPDRGHLGGRPAGRPPGLRAALRLDGGDDLRAVGLERLVLALGHQVDDPLVDADRLQASQAASRRTGRPTRSRRSGRRSRP